MVKEALILKSSNEEQLKAESRKISVKEASAYAISDGFGIRNITPYALSIGSSNFIISLLSSLPTLLGNFSQIFSSRLMEKYSRRKIVFWSVLIQAIMWLLVILPGVIYYLFNIHSSAAPIVLVIIYTFLTVSGAIAGPAWSSWMKDIVPEKSRGTYFGIRNKIAGSISLTLALTAGFILDYFKNTKIFLAFALFFFLAFIGRSISAYFFTKQYEPEFRVQEGYYFSFLQFLKRMFYNNFGHFVIFVSLMTFATAVAGPFFAVYLLNDLNIKSIQLGYFYYFLITLSASVTSIIFMPVWGKFSDKYGNLKVMKLTGVLIPLVPLSYLVTHFFSSLSTAIIFLFIAEAFSGFIWAGFNLAAGNFIYDAVTRQRLALCVAYFNMLNGVGHFLGAILGGLLASLSFNYLSLTPILWVFVVSAVIRFIVYFAIVSRVKEVRVVSNFDLNISKKLKFFPNLGKFDFIMPRLGNSRGT